MLEEVAYRMRGLVWLVRELVRLADGTFVAGVQALEARARQRRSARR